MTYLILILIVCAYLEREFLGRWLRWRLERPLMNAKDYARFTLEVEAWERRKPRRQVF